LALAKSWQLTGLLDRQAESRFPVASRSRFLLRSTTNL
jgi:hypothetical protein